VSAEYPFVLNIVAGPDGLSDDRASAIHDACGGAVTTGGPRWLARGHALDIGFSGDPDALRAKLRESVRDEWLLDLNVVGVGKRRKKLLIADMDSTIIACECIDELADQVGIKRKVSAITERAMRGGIDFPSALRERVALLKGLPLDALAKVYAERVRLNLGAKSLTSTMRAHGAHTLLVSGGFTYFTSRVAQAAGFENHQANRLADDGHALTGMVIEPILGREAKLEALRSAVVRLGITSRDVLAVGDGANDLDMIKAAGLGVAFHAKPIVAAAAAASIAHSDLTTLLYLQGYSDEEIVRP
jgi:phosphoserine phosphatase